MSKGTCGCLEFKGDHVGRWNGCQRHTLSAYPVAEFTDKSAPRYITLSWKSPSLLLIFNHQRAGPTVMTLFLPLDGAPPPPSTPTFLIHTDNALAHLRNVVDTILKAKRLVVVCGACLCSHKTSKLPIRLHISDIVNFKVLEYRCRLAFLTFDPQVASSRHSKGTTQRRPSLQAKISLMPLYLMWVVSSLSHSLSDALSLRRPRFLVL